MSQEAAARALDMSVVWVQRIEQGRGTPSPNFLLRYMDLLGIDPHTQIDIGERYSSIFTARRYIALPFNLDIQLRRIAFNEQVTVSALIERFLRKGLEEST